MLGVCSRVNKSGVHQMHKVCWHVCGIAFTQAVYGIIDCCLLLLLTADINHPPVTVSEFTEKMALLRSAMDEGLEDEYHVS